jgi:hypothetical protein
VLLDEGEEPDFDCAALLQDQAAHVGGPDAAAVALEIHELGHGEAPRLDTHAGALAEQLRAEGGRALRRRTELAEHQRRAVARDEPRPRRERVPVLVLAHRDRQGPERAARRRLELHLDRQPEEIAQRRLHVRHVPPGVERMAGLRAFRVMEHVPDEDLSGRGIIKNDVGLLVSLRGRLPLDPPRLEPRDRDFLRGVDHDLAPGHMRIPPPKIGGNLFPRRTLRPGTERHCAGQQKGQKQGFSHFPESNTPLRAPIPHGSRSFASLRMTKGRVSAFDRGPGFFRGVGDYARGARSLPK